MHCSENCQTFNKNVKIFDCFNICKFRTLRLFFSEKFTVKMIHTVTLVENKQIAESTREEEQLLAPCSLDHYVADQREHLLDARTIF